MVLLFTIILEDDVFEVFHSQNVPADISHWCIELWNILKEEKPFGYFKVKCTLNVWKKHEKYFDEDAKTWLFAIIDVDNITYGDNTESSIKGFVETEQKFKGTKSLIIYIQDERLKSLEEDKKIAVMSASEFYLFFTNLRAWLKNNQQEPEKPELSELLLFDKKMRTSILDYGS